MTAAPSSLSVDGLCLEAGSQVLVDGAGFTVRRGEVHALVGASGSGKTLSCLSLLGLLPPNLRRTAGEIRLDGRALDAAAVARLRGRVAGLVQQNPRSGFNPIVRLDRHFRESLALAGLRGRAAQKRAAALLADVGFDNPRALLRLYPFQMSGGMLQRAMIALALAHDPAFLIADEPTTDLDLVSQRQLLDLLDHQRTARGLGILLVTHDLSVTARMADTVSVMQGGRVVESAAVAALFHAPRSPEATALLNAHHRLYRAGALPDGVEAA